MSADGEIEREARRIFRKLAAPGAHLVPQGTDAYRLVSRAELQAARIAPLAAATVEAFARRGWLRRAGAAGTYVLSDAGKGWIERAGATGDPFAEQHQIRRTRLVKDAAGVERRVTVDEGESPLARLKQRGLIDGTQFDAGEKLRRDFTLAQLMPRLGVDYSAAVVIGRRGQKSETSLADTVLAAKQRFARAHGRGGAGIVGSPVRHLLPGGTRQCLAEPLGARGARPRAGPLGGSLRPARPGPRADARLGDGGGMMRFRLLIRSHREPNVARRQAPRIGGDEAGQNSGRTRRTALTRPRSRCRRDSYCP